VGLSPSGAGCALAAVVRSIAVPSHSISQGSPTLDRQGIRVLRAAGDRTA